MDTSLRIVFLGTPDFAVASLKATCEAGWNIVGVVTAPDRKAGRGQQLKPSAVKQYALKEGLPILQPTNLKNPEFIVELKALKADIQIVVAFRMLPEVVWQMPKHGTFNLHASLLPSYRGAAPINWAIINGEEKTGVTTFFLKHEIDTGNIAFQESIPIHIDDDAGSLHDKLMQVGSALVLRTLEAFCSNTISLKSQTSLTDSIETLPKAPKIFRKDCQINWSEEGEMVRNKIRGLSPFPGAWSRIENHDQKKLDIKVFKAQLSNISVNNEAAGILKIDGKKIFVSTKDYWIELIELQVQGKKRMRHHELLNGFPLHEYTLSPYEN